MNNCPERAVETAHGMAAGIIFLITAANSALVIFFLYKFNIRPDVWWWKISSQILAIVVMILISAVVYSIVHRAMGFKPFHYLVKYTSLTTLPFWRRYKYPERIKKKVPSNEL
jgi:Na+-translocating ferredoxin:NAD+ oxidoreductase RnfA subunit